MNISVNNDFAKQVFTHKYIFNDSRLEGVNVSLEEAAEIVEDIQHNSKLSSYYNEDGEVFLNIAGHREMYEYAFTYDGDINSYTLCNLNKLLFSKMPYPEFGGKYRTNNAIITSSSAEIVDYNRIALEMMNLNKEFDDLENNKTLLTRSKLIKKITEIHHRITTIHPFNDGNGRSSRCLMNMLLKHYGLLPIYIKVEHKNDYFRALSKADKGDFTMLNRMVYECIMRSHVDLAIDVAN